MSLIWKTPIVSKNTAFDNISNSMLEFTTKYGDRLPQLNLAKNLFCFSDYSGEEVESKNAVYSFLIINGDNLPEWDYRRMLLRSKMLSDGRRISYKQYRDKLSQKYIEEYLEIADQLEGYLITVSISKNLGSIFETGSPLDLSNPDFSAYSKWSTNTLEKAFQIMHLLGLFIAGFSTDRQNLIWITDNDAIASNNERITELTKLFSYVMSNYLSHDMGHLRVGTTNTDDGTRLIEDLCSLADLAAGSYSDQLKTMEAQNIKGLDDHFWLYAPIYKEKTRKLTWWLSTSNKRLCKLHFKINKNDKTNNMTSFYHFFDRD